MPGLENQEWWVKRALCPRGNSPHSSRLLPKFVDMLHYGFIYGLHIDHNYSIQVQYDTKYLIVKMKPFLLVARLTQYLCDAYFYTF